MSKNMQPFGCAFRRIRNLLVALSGEYATFWLRFFEDMQHFGCLFSQLDKAQFEHISPLYFLYFSIEKTRTSPTKKRFPCSFY